MSCSEWNRALSGQRHQTTFGLGLTFKKQAVPYLTAKPASLRAFAVPPEAIRFKPTEAKFLANSTRPVLSETLNKAGTKDISHHSQYKTFCALNPRGSRGGGAVWRGQSRISWSPLLRLWPGVGSAASEPHSSARARALPTAARPLTQPGPHSSHLAAAIAGVRAPRGTEADGAAPPGGRGAHRAGWAPWLQAARVRGQAGGNSGDNTCTRRRCGQNLSQKEAGRALRSPDPSRDPTRPCSISELALQGCKGKRDWLQLAF